MTERNKVLLDEIVIKPLSYKDSIDLINAGYPYSRAKLRRSQLENFFEVVRFPRRETRLVAYLKKRNRAIGSLSLVMHTKELYSIKYVFSDPKFRQRGIATKLVKYSLTLARNRGAKKVFLTPEPLGAASRIYQKLGFRSISEDFIVSGAGKTFNLQSFKRRNLLRPQSSSKGNRAILFSIYKSSLSQDFIDFFDIDKCNFINGYSQDFKRFFLKRVYINDSANSLALVFNRPLTHMAFAELYSQSDSFFPDMIRMLNVILYKKGINYLTINVFNVKTKAIFNLLELEQFYPYQSIFMGLSLS